MQKNEKFSAKAVVYIMLSMICSFALAGGAFLDIEMEHSIYLFDIMVKIFIMVGILAYSSLCGIPMNTPDSKFFTPWLLVALIPFIDNTIDYFRIPNRCPGVIEIISMLATVFTTAAWEEMFFRYVGRTLFERNGKYSIGAVVLLALTFGCSHLINVFFYDTFSVLLQVMHASVSGVFLLALYRHTGSLWLTITAHALQNFAGSVFDLFPDSELLFHSPVFFILSTIIQLTIGIYILIKYKYISKRI